MFRHLPVKTSTALHQAGTEQQPLPPRRSLGRSLPRLAHWPQQFAAWIGAKDTLESPVLPGDVRRGEHAGAGMLTATGLRPATAHGLLPPSASIVCGSDRTAGPSPIETVVGNVQTPVFRLQHLDGTLRCVAEGDLFDCFSQQPLADVFRERLQTGAPIMLCRLESGSEQEHCSFFYDAVSLRSWFTAHLHGPDPIVRQPAQRVVFYGAVSPDPLPQSAVLGDMPHLPVFYELGDHTVRDDVHRKDQAELLNVFMCAVTADTLDPRVLYYLASLMTLGVGGTLLSEAGATLKTRALAESTRYYPIRDDFWRAMECYFAERRTMLSCPEIYYALRATIPPPEDVPQGYAVTRL